MILSMSFRKNAAVFCFFAGIITGTVLFLCFGELYTEPFEYRLSVDPFCGNAEFYFFECLKKRFFVTAGIWILTVSLLSVPGTLAVIYLSGLTFSTYVVSCTNAFGGLGIAVPLVSGFPHMCCYLFIWLVLCRWGLKGEKKPHLSGLCLLFLLLCIGAAAETWIHPLFFSFFYKSFF